MQLENGYKTIVGGAGGHLSGGERQRISIARAMLKNAPIVILDEATAYTDPESEALVQSSVKNAYYAFDDILHYFLAITTIHGFSL